MLMRDQVFVTGGYGLSERLMPVDEQISRFDKDHNSFETQCGSWAAFKISEYLITLTGEAKYGDWAELLVINGIGASIPMSAKGEVFYYSDYCTSGGKKVHNQSAWPCCSATRAQAVPEYHDLIYYKDADGVFVNLYTASSVKWEKGQSVVTIRQVTDFPESEVVDLIVEREEEVRFPLRLRRPNWLRAPMTAAINGQSVALQNDDKGWAVIDRVWSSGDKLTIKLPMGFRVSRLDSAREYPAALAYGPVILAARYAKGNPAKLINPAKAAEDFEPVPGDTLSWRMKSEPDLLLRPFYRYKEGEAYFLYLDPNVVTPASFSHTDATLGGGEWKDFGDWMTSPHPGAWVEINFQGDALRVRGYRFDDAGRFAVIVDGKRVGVIDQYGPDRGEAASWDFGGLGPGAHRLRLEHLDEKSPESKGCFVNVAGFDCGF